MEHETVLLRDEVFQLVPHRLDHNSWNYSVMEYGMGIYTSRRHLVSESPDRPQQHTQPSETLPLP